MIRKNHSTSTSEAMTYTADNQLESWKKGTPDASGVIASPYSTQSWALDSRGNWSTFTNNGTPQTRTHTAANELTAMGASTLAWDAAGNMTSDGSRTYIWGARGLLDTVKQGTSVKGAYTYDPLGRRVMKTVGSIKTISIYDGWQCLYQKVTGSGTDTTKIYAYGNYIDEPVAMIRKWGTSTDTVWYLQGNNYNVEALTDRTGKVVERYAYNPYGAVTFVNNPGPDGKMYTADDIIAGSASARGNSFFFQGRELDGETGGYYYRDRYFQPTLGRFISRDPVVFIGESPNNYRFVENNPLAFLDPFGDYPPSHPYCKALMQKIENVKQDIRERWSELREDPKGLPAKVPGDKQKGSLSVRGHIWILQKQYAVLAANVALYAAKCSDDDTTQCPKVPSGSKDLQKLWNTLVDIKLKIQSIIDRMPAPDWRPKMPFQVPLGLPPLPVPALP